MFFLGYLMVYLLLALVITTSDWSRGLLLRRLAFIRSQELS
jgi:hypothetical protein